MALTFFDYGRWMGGPPGSWPDIPGHNSAYRRDALLAALERCPDGMDAETLLQEHIREAGGELYLDLGVARAPCERGGVRARPCASGWRSRACTRPEGRRTGDRSGALFTPPAARCFRSSALPASFCAARRGGYLGSVLKGADMMAVALVASAAGELLGYATRRCDPAATAEFELYRRRWAPSAP